MNLNTICTVNFVSLLFFFFADLRAVRLCKEGLQSTVASIDTMASLLENFRKVWDKFDLDDVLSSRCEKQDIFELD
jgi:hypothetical protein